MKRFLNAAGLALAVLSLANSMALAQSPPRLGYQGRLLTATGAPATGTPAITFSLFDVATGGAALWSETQTLGLSDGYYATLLGDATPAGCTGSACTGVPATVFDGTERFLELKVNGTALTPRQRVDSVAYALHAQTSLNVSGGTVNATSISIGSNTVIDATGHLVGTAAPPGFGADAGLVCEGNDPRLSDARTPKGPASGDLSGSYPGPTVVGLQGVPLAAASPGAGQFLGFNGSWGPVGLPVTSATVAGIAQMGTGLAATAGVASVVYGEDAGTSAPGDRLLANPLTLVVGPNAGAAFPSLTAAWTWLQSRRLAPTALVTLQLQAGTHTFAGQLTLNHPDGANISILGDKVTPTNVVLSFPSSSGIVVSGGSGVRLLDGVLIKGNSANSASNLLYYGVTVDQSSSLNLGTAVRISDFFIPVQVLFSSRLGMQGVQILNCAPNFPGADSIGVLAEYSASVQAYQATISGCSTGFYALYTSSIVAQSASVTNFKNQGYIAQFSGMVFAYNATASGGGASGWAYYAYNGASIHAQGSSSIGNPNAYVAGNASVIYAVGTTVSGATTAYSPAQGTTGNLGGVMQ